MGSRMRLVDENIERQVRNSVPDMRPPPSIAPTYSDNNNDKPKFHPPSEKEWKERAAKERAKVRKAEKSAEMITVRSRGFPDETFRGDKGLFQEGKYVHMEIAGGKYIENPEGYGTLTGESPRFIKSGHWKGRMMDGFGTHLDSDGSWYEGEWKSGKADGYGRKVFQDESSYFGEWVNGVANGSGRKVFKDGSTYSGDWVDGKFHGFGKREWKTGIVYEGEWHENMRHGEGSESHPGGYVWEGDWRFDKFVDGSVFRYDKNGSGPTKRSRKEEWRDGKRV